MKKKNSVIKALGILAGILLLSCVVLAAGFDMLKQNDGNEAAVVEEAAKEVSEEGTDTETGAETGTETGTETEEGNQETETQAQMDIFEVEGIQFYEKITPVRPEEGFVTREAAAASIAAEWKRLYPDAEYDEPVCILYAELEPGNEYRSDSTKGWAVTVKDGLSESWVDAPTGEVKKVVCPYKITNYGYTVTGHGYRRVEDEAWMNSEDFYALRDEEMWIQEAEKVIGGSGLNQEGLALTDPEVYFGPDMVYVTFTLGEGDNAEALQVFLFFKTREFLGYRRYGAKYRGLS